MKLSVTVDDKNFDIDIPEPTLREAEEFFRKMDRDMDRGWQMSREFIENPDRVQRCQIAADRLLIAMSTENETMMSLMAGYILTRLPKVTGVDINTAGEMLDTRFSFAEDAARAEPPPGGIEKSVSGGKLNRIEALDRASKEVTQVYRVGRVFRYAVLDKKTGKWIESEPVGSEKDAQAQRLAAFKQRIDELAGA